MGLYIVVEVIQHKGLGVEKVKVIADERGVPIAPCVFFGVDVDVVFHVNDLAVKIIVLNDLTGSIGTSEYFDPVFKIVQVFMDDRQIRCLELLEIHTLSSVGGDEVVLAVISEILKCAFGVKLTVAICTKGANNGVP